VPSSIESDRRGMTTSGTGSSYSRIVAIAACTTCASCG